MQAKIELLRSKPTDENFKEILYNYIIVGWIYGYLKSAPNGQTDNPEVHSLKLLATFHYPHPYRDPIPEAAKAIHANHIQQLYKKWHDLHTPNEKVKASNFEIIQNHK